MSAISAMPCSCMHQFGCSLKGDRFADAFDFDDIFNFDQSVSTPPSLFANEFDAVEAMLMADENHPISNVALPLFDLDFAFALQPAALEFDGPTIIVDQPSTSLNFSFDLHSNPPSRDQVKGNACYNIPPNESFHTKLRKIREIYKEL